MKYKRLLSALLSVCLLCNMVQTVPASAFMQPANNVVNVNSNVHFQVDEAAENAESPAEEGTTPKSEPIEPNVVMGENAISDPCGPTTSWSYDPDAHLLFIQGEGEVVSMTFKSDLWKTIAAQVETIVVDNTITALPDGAFNLCSAVTSLSMPVFGTAETPSVQTLKALFGYHSRTLATLTISGGEQIPDSFAVELSALTSLTIADTVAVIGDKAFLACSQLNSITFPAAIDRIGAEAFCKCTALTELNLPASIGMIGNYAFAYTALTAVTIPDGTEQIGCGLFYKCTTLTDLTLPYAGHSRAAANGTPPVPAEGEELPPDTLASIVYNNYTGVPITTVTITGGTTIPQGFFNSYSSLTTVNLADTITEIGKEAFRSCHLTTITLPSSLAVIGDEAFAYSESLASIEIPASVREIGASAFNQCVALAAVTFADGLQTLGKYAFNNCQALTNVALPATLETVGDFAFASTSLTTLTVPSSVTKIGKGIVDNVTTITEVTLPFAGYSETAPSSIGDILTNGSNTYIPENVAVVNISGGKSIPSHYFANATHLKTVTLADGIETICNDAFNGCTALTDITIPDSVFRVGANAFIKSGYYNALDNGIVYAGKVALGYKGDVPANIALKFKEDTVGIADKAFSNASAQVVSLSLPAALRRIGNYAFSRNSNLTVVSFPDGLEEIGSYAFERCTGLQKLELPDSLKVLDSYAFERCTGLVSIKVPDTIDTVGVQPFKDTVWSDLQTEGLVYIGKTLVGYKGTMSHGTSLTLRDDTTTIAEGALKGFEDLVSVTIPDSVTSIGVDAFRDCTALTEITLPNGLKTLGDSAFRGCTDLETVTLGSGLTVIPREAFYGCNHIKSITIPSTVQTIGYGAFGNCTMLRDVTISDSIKTIEGGAFDCSSNAMDGQTMDRTLTVAEGCKTVNRAMTRAFVDTAVKLVLPSTLTVIGENAFEDFNRLTEVTIPENVTTISNHAFYECTGLEKITLPESLQTIGSSAFTRCTSLAELTLPAKLTKLGEYAFYGCSALTDVTIPGTVKTISYEAFAECTALKSATLMHGVTTVDSSVFDGCTALTTLTVPDTLKVGRYSVSCREPEEGKLPDITLHATAESTSVTEPMVGIVRNRLTEFKFTDQITEIGSKAFTNCDALQKMNVPDTIKTIGGAAFSDCDGLTELTLPTKLETIPESMAYRCSSLKNITIPETVTAIGNSAFAQCDALQTAKIPANAQTLGESIFADCTALQAIQFPEGIRDIPNSICAGCSMLQNVSFPESVTSIGSYAFHNCYNLSDIVAYDYITDVNRYAFGWGRDYVVGRTLHVVKGSVRLPDSLIASLGSSLISVNLPDTLTKIQERAFEDCSRLTSISIPDSVTSIGNYAFKDCTSLTELVLPNSLEALSNGICYGCSQLTSVTMPDTIKHIPTEAFAECGKLEKVNLKNENPTFRGNSFRNCYSLYDPRFNIIDRRNINFTASTDSAAQNDIVNLTLDYAINSELLQSDEITVSLKLPSNVVLLYNSLAEEQGLDLSNNNIVTLKTKKTAGTVRYAVRMLEYGDVNITASLGFRFDNMNCEEGVGTVTIHTPEVSISAPSSINSNSLAVRGFATPGKTVRILADGTEVGTATANERTGKFSTTVKVPAVEDGSTVTITAVVDDYTSAPVTVKYTTVDPIVERVEMTSPRKLDLTPAFTEGTRPAISINPSHPFEFEITIANDATVSRVYLTSTKGTDKKYLEAKWSPARGAYVAYGYFDPNNHHYAPGALNIKIITADAAYIDLQTGDVTGPQAIIDEIFEEQGTEKTNLKELDPTLPEDVAQNSNANTVYESDTAFISEIHASDGKQSTDFAIYQETTNYVYINGEKIPVSEIAKDPAAYGYIRTTVSAGDGTDVYDYYVRSVDSSDTVKYVSENMYRNDPTGSYSPDQVQSASAFGNGMGSSTLVVPRNYYDREFDQNFDNVTSGVGNVTNVVSAIATPADQVLSGITDVDAGTKYFKTYDSFDELRNAANLADNTDTMASLAKAGKIVSKVSTVLDVVETAVNAGKWMKQITQASGNPALQLESTALMAGRMASTWAAKPMITAGLTKAGAAIGTAICPGIGTVIGGLAGAFLGVVAGWGIDSLFDWWEDSLEERIDAYQDGAMPRWIIDPSGYVYEAVPSNRISGAKMTIYYKDPETGQETEWSAGDYDQENPLTTNENGEYAWDVPEGLWKVKFELEGYEAQSSEWMEVPPIQTDVNFSVVSKAVPEVISLFAADNKINMTFSKYMDIKTLNDKTVSLYLGSELVPSKITPVASAENKDIAMTYLITPAEGAFPSGDLTVVLTEGCKSYSGTSVAAQVVDVVRPSQIVSLKADTEMVMAAQGASNTITVTAVPASVASGKKLTVKDTTGIVKFSEDVVFDKDGKAVLTITPSRTGLAKLTLGIEGEDITSILSVVAVTEKDAAADVANVTTTTKPTTTTTTKTTTTTTKTTTTTTKTTTSTTKTTTTTTKTTPKATTTTTKATTTTTTTKATTTTTKETTTTTQTTTTTTPIVTTPTEPAFLRGDVNDNGSCSVDDAQLTLLAYTNSLAGIESGLTDEQAKVADVDENGEVNVEDAQYILIYYTDTSVAGKDITWDDILKKNTPAKALPALWYSRTY